MKQSIIWFLYNTSFGTQVLRIITRPSISKIMGCIMDFPCSALLVKGFIRKHRIDMRGYKKRRYRSFNDFFTRKKEKRKLKIDYEKSNFISPCDSMLRVYKINNKSIFNIKNFDYKVSELVESHKLTEEYSDGICLVFRLDVDNYHRYCYLDNCKKSGNVVIPGLLHTVQDAAMQRVKVLQKNSREYSILNTQNFGKLIQIEVGALLVGKIVNHHGAGSYKRGMEKGFFKFGGSTIVVLIKKDMISLNKEILVNSYKKIETPVKYGEQIGKVVVL